MFDGWDVMEALLEITEADLSAMGVKTGHRRLILKKLAALE